MIERQLKYTSDNARRKEETLGKTIKMGFLVALLLKIYIAFDTFWPKRPRHRNIIGGRE